MATIPLKYITRQAEITAKFMEAMNTHMDAFMAGETEHMLSLKEIAAIMCLHPVHVTNVIKLHTGHHPCYFYEHRILAEARALLKNPHLSITDIAIRLTYDTSNFTKFFKQYEGITPSAFRKQNT
ncbi:helix-turn-helix transcriptional regulator [Chitinophaga sp.]|uniref:helix-turn-helix transcriptional regulator n=1 Tax=Chitinophaga sp. TaxID=1869181 RepID=UPI0031DA2CF6